MSHEAAPRWTPDQERAITATGTNILVAAAAGSGKTATLIERVVRRLTDPARPIDVDQLLVVTFTEAAATEMRERMGLALQKALVANPEDARLQRQLAMMGRAAISTLHSFCLGLIRRHFYQLGLDPMIRVMSEHEALLLRGEVLDELFARSFDEQPDGPFYALVDRYGGGRDDSGLRKLVMELYDYVQSLPWPDQWLSESVGRFAVAPDASLESLPWFPAIERQIQRSLAVAASALKHASRLCRKPGAPIAYEARLEQDLAALGEARQAEGWDGFRAGMQRILFERLPAVKKGEVDESLQTEIRKLRDMAKSQVRKVMEAFFTRSDAELIADLQAVEPEMRTLAELVRQFTAAFRKAKDEQGLADFNDLERFCLQLLCEPKLPAGCLQPSAVARELRAQFAEVLVDEYQDTNGVQDAILTLVARDGKDGVPNRFMVGDVKQSIYRFRHADPSLFLAKYRAYPDWSGESGTQRAEEIGGQEVDTQGDAPVGRRIVLGANFRSRSGVVNAVNFIFRQILTTSVGELEYGQEAELVCHATYPERPDMQEAPPVELYLLERSLDATSGAAGGLGRSAASEGDEIEGFGEQERSMDAGEGAELAGMHPPADLAELSALEREARLVARRIRELVHGTQREPALRVWENGTGVYRPVQYRDIVILLRATSGRANIFLESLSLAGINAYAQLNTGYFSAVEVELFLSLLQVLDNPRQDIPLAAVLRSPVIGLSAAELARIRLTAPTGTYFDAVIMASRTLDQTDLGVTLRHFLITLDQWRTAARRKPLSQVVWQIFQETGYLNYVLGMPGGTDRQANLLALYERARQFDQFARQGLFRFLRFIERLRAEEQDMGTAPALGEGADVVRIMSIHKSKGLEFPVVFVCDLGKAFGKMDQQGDLLLQRDMGLGPMLVDPDQRIKYPTLAFHAVREAIHMEALAEEMRILYVALTRARERLILTGSCKELIRRCERWVQELDRQGWQLSDSVLSGAETYLDWLMPAIARHRSGKVLCEAAGVGAGLDPLVAADPSLWDLHLLDAAAQAALAGEDGVRDGAALDWEQIGSLIPMGLVERGERLEREITFDLPAQLQARFSWQYPYASLFGRFAKLSVTELKGHFHPEEEEGIAEVAVPGTGPVRQRAEGQLGRRPAFMQEAQRSLAPTELGTVMHLVMQHLDLSQPLNAKEIAVQVLAMAGRGLLTQTHAGAVDVAAIADFFASPLGKRIAASPHRLRREVSFTLSLPANEVYTDLDPAVAAGESVIVQGMIDLLLELDDGFLLLDYKTDRRPPAKAAEQYRYQVGLYRRAVEKIYGRPVKEAYLHFLSARVSVPM